MGEFQLHWGHATGQTKQLRQVEHGDRPRRISMPQPPLPIIQLAKAEKASRNHDIGRSLSCLRETNRHVWTSSARTWQQVCRRATPRYTDVLQRLRARHGDEVSQRLSLVRKRIRGFRRAGA
jgi:hypothetical protein